MPHQGLFLGPCDPLKTFLQMITQLQFHSLSFRVLFLKKYFNYQIKKTFRILPAVQAFPFKGFNLKATPLRKTWLIILNLESYKFCQIDP